METLDLVVREPMTVPGCTTVAEAARRMEGAGVDCLLVVNGDRLVGIVTARDLAFRVLARRLPFDGRVDAVMTRDVATLPGHAGRDEGLDMFRRHAVRQLPVVVGTRVVGLASLEPEGRRSDQGTRLPAARREYSSSAAGGAGLPPRGGGR